MSVKMGVVPAVLWWAVLALAARSAVGEKNDTLPDVIIGKLELVSVLDYFQR